MIFKFWSFVAITFVAATYHVRAQELGDSQRGHTLAEQICAECHFVEKGSGPSPNPNSPTFATIGAVPGMTRTALIATLRTSHRTMPNIILTAEQTSDIIAYILSLKEGAARIESGNGHETPADLALAVHEFAFARLGGRCA